MTEEKPQGFVIVVENCRINSQARIYLAKIRGDKKSKACGPNREDILGAIQEFLPICWRVVLLTMAHSKESSEEVLIGEIKGEYPEIEIVRMSHHVQASA